MNKTITIIVIVIVAIGMLTGLSKQIVNALNASQRLDDETNKVTSLTQKNNQLKKELALSQSQDEVEKIARDKLNMGKPGETVVVIPEELITKVIEENKPKIEPQLPNWQGWIKLFIH
jgi:cell division protein FtsB